MIAEDGFGRQFIDAMASLRDGGSMLFRHLLVDLEEDASGHAANIISMVASLARSSARNYGPLLQAGILPSLCQCLQSPQATLRAKACNAFGNLFRHSGQFYKPFQKFVLGCWGWGWGLVLWGA